MSKKTKYYSKPFDFLMSKKTKYYSKSFDFLINDIDNSKYTLIAKVDKETGKQQLIITYIRNNKIIDYNSLDCIHTAINQIDYEEYKKVNDSSELKLKLYTQSSENIEIHISPYQHFKAFSSWCQGIAEMGLESLYIQNEIEILSKFSIPISNFLYLFIIRHNFNKIYDYIELIIDKCKFENEIHESSIIGNFNNIFDLIQKILYIQKNYININSNSNSNENKRYLSKKKKIYNLIKFIFHHIDLPNKIISNESFRYLMLGYLSFIILPKNEKELLYFIQSKYLNIFYRLIDFSKDRNIFPRFIINLFLRICLERNVNIPIKEIIHILIDDLYPMYDISNPNNTLSGIYLNWLNTLNNTQDLSLILENPTNEFSNMFNEKYSIIKFLIHNEYLWNQIEITDEFMILFIRYYLSKILYDTKELKFFINSKYINIIDTLKERSFYYSFINAEDIINLNHFLKICFENKINIPIKTIMNIFRLDLFITFGYFHKSYDIDINLYYKWLYKYLGNINIAIEKCFNYFNDKYNIIKYILYNEKILKKIDLNEFYPLFIRYYLFKILFESKKKELSRFINSKKIFIIFKDKNILSELQFTSYINIDILIPLITMFDKNSIISKEEINILKKLEMNYKEYNKDRGI